MDKVILALGIVAIVVCAMICCFKKRYQMLLCLLVYNILLLVQYLLQNYITEFLIVIIDFIRTIVFFVFALKNFKPNIVVIVLFEIATATCCILTWQNWFSIFIMIASMLTTFSYWQKNVLLIRIFSAVSSILIIVNYVFKCLYTTIIAEAISFVSALVSIFVYRKEFFGKEKTEKETQEQTDLQNNKKSKNTELIENKSLQN